MRIHRKIGLAGAAIAAVLAVAAVPPSNAAGGAAADIATRQAIMKSIATHVGAIKAAAPAGNGEAVAAHATAINALAKVVGNLFPKGSGKESGVETRALPKIWEDMNGFVAADKTLIDESAKLAELAKGGADGNAMMAQFGAMGKNGCGGCHSTYREKKD